MTDNIDKRFALDVWRSSQDRKAMVMDPDCPRSVLEVVATHDTDEDVVMAVLVATRVDDDILSIISSRYGYTVEELKAQIQRELFRKDDKRVGAFCGVPWNHVSMTADGSVRMCCQMINSKKLEGDEHYGTVLKSDGNVLKVTDDLSEHRNEYAWKTIRKEMMNGVRPAICELCWHEEDNGIGSRREWTNQVFSELYDLAIEHTQEDGSIDHETFPIQHWDLRFGNKCNLACRSCGPTDSDLWYRDWKQFTGRDTFTARAGDLTIDYSNKRNPVVKDSPYEWFENDSTLERNIQDNITHIKRFYFTGGEPTINHTHRELLQFCINGDYAKDITLDYNTNMAGVPNAIFEQWKHFKKVNLGMSIDGIYEHFEYIRYPGKWSAAYKNMKRIDSAKDLDHVTASITMTVSILNILHILDMQWWMKEQNWNSIEQNIIVHNLYGPEFLNTQNLPTEMKKYISDRYYKFINDIKEQWPTEMAFTNLAEVRLGSIIQHMNAKEMDPEKWEEFKKNTAKLDTIRKESFRDSIPEIYQMIEKIESKQERTKNVKLATTNKK